MAEAVETTYISPGAAFRGWVMDRDGVEGALRDKDAIMSPISLLPPRIAQRVLAAVAASRDGDVAEGVDAADAAFMSLKAAAEDAARSEDYGDVVVCLSVALSVHDGPASERAEVVERLVQAALYSGLVADAAATVASELGRTRESGVRGRLLMCRSRLEWDLGDAQGRVHSLQQAHDAFLRGQDHQRRAIALAHLALPGDTVLSIERRISFGSEALRIAEMFGDEGTFNTCANNLAAAKLQGGDPSAFELWNRAAAALEGADPSGSGDEIVRTRCNCAVGALDFGAYDEARIAIIGGFEVLGAAPQNPTWQRSLHLLEGIRLWRTGSWREALLELEHATELSEPEAAIATAVGAAIAFEFEQPVRLHEIAAAADTLMGYGDISWSALTYAILFRLRAARREPRPTRGLVALSDAISAEQSRVGWDDVLPAAAAVDVRGYRRMRNSLGPLRAVGPRAEASTLLAEGQASASHVPVERWKLLMDAADAYEVMGEPYGMATALFAAAVGSRDAGRNPREFVARAAETFHDLHCRHSQRLLLRRFPNERCLERFRSLERPSPTVFPSLTRREKEVADLVARGYSAREAAEDLGVSTRTIEKHLEHIKRKLEVDKKSQLIRLLGEPVGQRPER